MQITNFSDVEHVVNSGCRITLMRIFCLVTKDCFAYGSYFHCQENYENILFSCFVFCLLCYM
jgi:hypothetical protein